jgi:hypothetical protein
MYDSKDTVGDTGVVEAKDFRQGITLWARQYALRYRDAPSPKPSMDDAREDLQRWSGSYCGRDLKLITT